MRCMDPVTVRAAPQNVTVGEEELFFIPGLYVDAAAGQGDTLPARGRFGGPRLTYPRQLGRRIRRNPLPFRRFYNGQGDVASPNTTILINSGLTNGNEAR